MLEFKNGWLVGMEKAPKTSPNHGGKLVAPKFIVAHWTGGHSFDGAMSWLTNPKAKASAHFVVGRAGELAQLVPIDVVAWHAGVSRWEVKDDEGKSVVYVGLNKHALGIEFVNCGRLLGTEGGTFVSAAGHVVDSSEVVRAAWDGRYYQTYSEEQLEKGVELMVALKAHIESIEDVIGHHDVAPNRKLDPGPVFPIAHFRGKLFGRHDPEDVG